LFIFAPLSMKLRLYIGMVVICFAIGGLTFTSLFFYDVNTKIVMVEEVQEEESGEDLALLESHSATPDFHGNWSELISQSSDVKYHAQILLSELVRFNTSAGYFLDLIKPPMV